MADLEPFVSPIDGTIVSGRVAYAEHCKKHNVTNVADYKESWAKAAEERARLFSGQSHDAERRKEALARNYKEFKNYDQFKRHLERIGRRR